HLPRPGVVFIAISLATGQSFPDLCSLRRRTSGEDQEPRYAKPKRPDGSHREYRVEDPSWCRWTISNTNSRLSMPPRHRGPPRAEGEQVMDKIPVRCPEAECVGIVYVPKSLHDDHDVLIGLTCPRGHRFDYEKLICP